jgi:hypothetical protein
MQSSPAGRYVEKTCLPVGSGDPVWNGKSTGMANVLFEALGCSRFHASLF